MRFKTPLAAWQIFDIYFISERVSNWEKNILINLGFMSFFRFFQHPPNTVFSQVSLWIEGFTTQRPSVSFHQSSVRLLTDLKLEQTAIRAEPCWKDSSSPDWDAGVFGWRGASTGLPLSQHALCPHVTRRDTVSSSTLIHRNMGCRILQVAVYALTSREVSFVIPLSRTFRRPADRPAVISCLGDFCFLGEFCRSQWTNTHLFLKVQFIASFKNHCEFASHSAEWKLF